jgi:hypothetical protein
VSYIQGEPQSHKVTDGAGGEEKFVGGLSVATFITLLLVPVIYAIFVLGLK